MKAAVLLFSVTTLAASAGALVAGPPPAPEMCPFNGHVGNLHSLALSADGKRLVTGSLDCTVKLWDARDGTPIRTIAAVVDIRGLEVVFSPDSVCFAVLLPKVGIEIRRAATGALLRVLTDNLGVSRGVFSPDGASFLALDGSDRVKVWNLHTGEPAYTARAGLTYVGGAAFSPDGKWLAFSGIDVKEQGSAVEVWDRAMTVRSARFADPDLVGPVAFSPDGRSLAAGVLREKGYEIQLWDRQPPRLRQAFQLPRIGLGEISFSRDGDRILAAGSGRIVECGAGRDTVIRPLFRGEEPFWPATAASPAGLAAVHEEDGAVAVYQRSTGAPLYRLDNSLYGGSAVFASPRGDRFLVGGQDRFYRFAIAAWSAKTGAREIVHRGEPGICYDVCSDRRGALWAYSLGTGSAWLWWPGSGDKKEIAVGHTRVLKLALSTDGSQLMALAAPAEPGTGTHEEADLGPRSGCAVSVWDVATGKRTIEKIVAGVPWTAVQLRRDAGGFVVVQDRTARAWALAFDRFVPQDPVGFDGKIDRHALSETGHYLAVLQENGRVSVIDLRTQEVIRRGTIERPDGCRGVYVSADGVQVGVIDEAQQLHRWELAHDAWPLPSMSRVFNAVYRPDGTLLLVDAAGALRLLDSTDHPIATFQPLSRGAIDTWATYLPTGEYTAGPQAERCFRWVIGEQVLDAEPLKERFERPAAVAKKLGEHRRSEATPR
jgi:WD40 repeat protein